MQDINKNTISNFFIHSAKNNYIVTNIIAAVKRFFYFLGIGVLKLRQQEPKPPKLRTTEKEILT